MQLLAQVRSPEWGLPGQGLRFAIAGGTVALVYLATTLLLAEGLGAPFQVALAVGFTFGLILHFTLQRIFVWTHREEFALGLRQQVVRYLCLAGLQYGATAAVTAVLPDALGLPVAPIYFAAVVIVTLLNFVIFRGRVFHPQR